MTIILVLPAFLILLFLTYREVKSMRFDRLTFLDGTLIGCSYYLAIPLFVTLMTGELPPLELRAEPFRPYDDINVSAAIGLGWLTLIGLRRLTAAVTIYPRSTRGGLDGYSAKHYGAIILLLYGATSIASFFLLGKATTGHWQENANMALSTNFTAVLIANLANVFRGAIFGFLILLVEKKLVERRLALLIGIGIVFVDLALTFNRITAAYFAITMLILYRDRLVTLFLIATPCLPIVASLSDTWSVVRAMILNNGFNFSSIAEGVSMGSAISATHDSSIFTKLNSIFEADNILVFSHIVKNTPDQMQPLWGTTYILRTFGVFVPSTIWPDKPVTFGNIIGMNIEGVDLLALNSTLFGEPYGNFYLFWIPAMAAMLLFFNWIFTTLSKRFSFVSAFAFFSGFAIWRFENSFTMISLIGVSVFIMFHLSAAALERLTKRGIE